ncbi:uncharacterized protein YaiI (UPF0178 family) [Pullulanibacillus pueri]|uniref:UPF0178 protein GCM10007096_29390 n=1 Tax=Pullulanibacillus pueri TaxID=1437324 RepID=A0A8J2ZXT6_9BACL|nr:DUF188 domain-containing protein [Pullulanibacillus pueri]MBM7683034.1 uncharacterized protein YaiI (UPF0178 family) [Pullulanibacillus pueri]GGH85004.1 UPF0178 protein YqxD [Pullulanibacillus pueri]
MVEKDERIIKNDKDFSFYLFVDADACPVKDEISEVASAYNIEVTYVASYNHYSNQKKGHWIMVDPDREAADLYIVNHVRTGDVVVTWDMGLAGLLTNRGVYVLTPNGKEIVEEDMAEILHFRYLAKIERMAHRHTKGPRPFTNEDRSAFKKALKRLIMAHG